MSSTPEYPSGFTIIEVLVSMGLLLFLLGGLYTVLVTGMRDLHQREAFQAARQQALVGSSALDTELGESNIKTVIYGTSPDYIIFLSPEGMVTASNPTIYTYDGSGHLQWHKWVCYYLAPTRKLIRSEVALTSPVSLPPSPLQPPLSTFQSASPDLTRVIARDIYSLDIARGDTPGTLRVGVTARKYTASDKFTQMDMSSQVQLQN